MHLLNKRMKELESALGTLRESLLSAKLVQAEVYQMPFITKEQESEYKNSLNGIDHLPVTMLQGSEALEEAIKAFNHMYVLDETLSTYYVQKWPGLLVFEPCETELKRAIKNVNEAKNNFKKEVQALGDRDEKFEIVHSLFHRLVTYAAYRQVHCYDDVQACYFSWQRRTKSERITKEDAKHKIANQRGKLSTLDRLARQRTIDAQLSRLESCDESALRIRKPAQVRPVVSVKTESKLFGTTCGTPIITFSDKPIALTPLPTLDKPKGRRSRVEAYRPVVPHLYMYEKRC